MRLCTLSLTVLATAILFSSTALAQTGVFKAEMASQPPSVRGALSTPTTSAAPDPADDYYVQYFRNENTAGYNSAVVDIVDPASNGAGDMCANIYIFTPDEELAECCGCVLTPDQLIEIPVGADLVHNPANGKTIHNGVIAIVSSAALAGNTCDAGTVTPAPALRAWITRDNNETGVHAVTENAFLDAALVLSPTELTAMTTSCAFYESHLSGTGRCTCPPTLPD